MLFATERGLVTFLESEKKWAVYSSQNSGLPDDYITALMEDRAGRILLGTNRGVVVLEP
jgi:ligand-binding sensor domain-containing protein